MAKWSLPLQAQLLHMYIHCVFNKLLNLHRQKKKVVISKISILTWLANYSLSTITWRWWYFQISTIRAIKYQHVSPVKMCVPIMLLLSWSSSQNFTLIYHYDQVQLLWNPQWSQHINSNFICLKTILIAYCGDCIFYLLNH